MNTDVYVFGNFENGYSQYPLGDDKKSLFQNCIRLAESPTQIVIHREGCLMYYSYIRMLSYGHCVGFCVVLNGVSFKTTDALFDVFENTISYLARNRILIKIDSDGTLMADVEDLTCCPVDVDEGCSYIRALLESEQEKLGLLPPINYGLQQGSIKYFDFDNDQEAIVNFSYKMCYVVVCKNTGYDTEKLIEKMNQIKMEAQTGESACSVQDTICEDVSKSDLGVVNDEKYDEVKDTKTESWSVSRWEVWSTLLALGALIAKLIIAINL